MERKAYAGPLAAGIIDSNTREEGPRVVLAIASEEPGDIYRIRGDVGVA
jgi:hypothetical protein